MVEQLSNNWFWVALRGVLAILFGIVAFIAPDTVLLVSVIWFGAFAFIDGIFSVIAAFTNRTKNDRWWVLLLEGILGIVVGVLTFIQPGATLLTFVLFIGAWLVITGVLEIVAAIRLRQEIQGELWLILSGVVSVIAGVLMFVFPGAGALTGAYILGAYAIVFGVMLLVLSFRLRGMKSQTTGGKPAMA